MSNAEKEMTSLTRRSVLGGSLGLGTVGALARPYIANAAATTAEMWWGQGFAEEEDISLKKIVADYEKASGNKVDLSIIPFAPLRQKAVSAITSGVVPDIMETADLEFAALQSWDDKLLDVGDIVNRSARTCGSGPCPRVRPSGTGASRPAAWSARPRSGARRGHAGSSGSRPRAPWAA